MHLFGKKLLNNLSIGKKLNLCFGFLAALTLLVAMFNAFSSSRVTQEIDRTRNVRVPAALASTQAQYSLLAMVADVHGYLALGDLKHIAHYYVAQRTFETNLAELERLAPVSSTPEQARSLNELRATYTEWSALTEKMYALYNNPRLNQPGLYLYRTKIPPLRETILENIGSMIQLQGQREDSTENGKILADMVNFQNSFDAMMTNLLGYALTGDLSFRNGYMARLPLNTTAWANLQSSRELLTAAQRVRLDNIAAARLTLVDLPSEIFSVVQGEHAYESLYLFQTKSAPEADRMLSLLSQMTAEQQQMLQTDLAAGRRSLADTQLQSLVGSLMVLFLGIGMAAILRNTIVSPVRGLTEAAERIASGNLHAHALVESDDEIGQLADTFNLMIDQLHQTFASLENQTQQLEAMKEVAEAASLAKSEFLTNMSHELRTPLNGILGYAQILARDKNLSAAQASAVNNIHSSGEHLLTLINDILDLSKIEARKMELHPTDFHLPDFLEAIIGMFQIRAEQKKDIAFIYRQITPLPIIVHADERRLRQILINLIGNAIKFTDQGKIVFQVGLIAPDTLASTAPRTQSTEDTTCYLRFEVIDTGIGIQADKLDHIFLPFEQVSDPHRRAEGTGLGLTITRNLVEAMNGRLTVESEPGQGSTFRLELEIQTLWMAGTFQQSGYDDVARFSGREYNQLTAGDKKLNRTAPGRAISEDDLVPPPPTEIAILYDLVMKGELPNLRQRALHIEQMGEQYRAFATRLCRLVERYDEDEILALIERYMNVPGS